MLVSSQMEDLSPVASLLLLAMLCDYVMGQSKELNFFFSPPPPPRPGLVFSQIRTYISTKRMLQELAAGGGEQNSPPLWMVARPPLDLKPFVRLCPSPSVSEEESILVFTCFDLLCGCKVLTDLALSCFGDAFHVAFLLKYCLLLREMF